MSLFDRKPKPKPKPDASTDIDAISPPPAWIADAMSIFDGPTGFDVSDFHVHRVRQILGSLEYEPTGGVVSITTTLVISHFSICFRVHPLEVDLVVPWLWKPRIIRREYGRVVEDSLVRNPNVRQLREALAWVDSGYLNRNTNTGEV